MILKKKTITTFIALGAVSMLIGAGCGSDEDDNAGTGGMGGATGGTSGDGDGDGTGGDGTGGEATGGDGGGGGATSLGSCEDLCAASAAAECGPEAACLGACMGLEASCADKIAAYLECGETASSVSCIPNVPLGLIAGCQAEGLALQTCPMGMGGGGAGGM